ncbi:MAG: PqiC family protein [Pseudomonadota bacterium]
MIRALMTLGLFACISACAPAPEPRLFLLGAPAGATTATSAAVTAPVIGLREIALPLYARRPQVAAQSADGTLIASDQNRWAEDPPRAATRLVARTLMMRTGADVFEEPWGREADPDLVAAVEVDRFIGGLGGEVTLEGQLSISSRRAQGRPRLVPFAISEPVAGNSWDGLTDAYGRAVQALGNFVAAQISDGNG